MMRKIAIICIAFVAIQIYAHEAIYMDEIQYRELGQEQEYYTPRFIYEYALIKVTIINPEPGDSRLEKTYPYKVLLGKVPKNIEWDYNPSLCSAVPFAGEYLVLVKFLPYSYYSKNPEIHNFDMFSKCPIKDTKENRQQLTDDWIKCLAWDKIEKREKLPPEYICGKNVIEPAFRRFKKSNLNKNIDWGKKGGR